MALLFDQIPDQVPVPLPSSGGTAALPDFDAMPTPSAATPQMGNAVTDIIPEIKNAAGTALGQINTAFNPNAPENIASFNAEKSAPLWDVSGEFHRLDAVGRGLMAIGGLAAAPFTGAGRSLIGHALAATTPHGFYGPDVTTPEQTYARAKQDADMAMAAVAPARGAISFPAAARLPAAAKPTPAPTIAQLYDAADGDYKVARAMDVNVDPQSVANFAGGVQTQMERDGFRDYLAPKTFSALKEMQTVPSGTGGVKPLTNLADIDGMRKVLGKAAGDFTNPTEQEAAGRAIAALDNYVRNVPPADVISGDPTAAQNVLNSARGNYAAAKRADMIESQQDKAERQAGVSGSGANVTNTMRQRMNQILNNDRMQRGFTQDELDQIRSIAVGTPVGNLARKIGKLAPTGVVSSIPVFGALALGEPMSAAALGVAGHAAKALGEASTLKGIDALSEMTRSRSPLGVQIRSLPPRPGGKPSLRGTVAGALMRPNLQWGIPTIQAPALAYGGDENQQNVPRPPAQ